MKPEEVIKQLKEIKYTIVGNFVNTEYDKFVNDSIDAIDYATECIKKQIPKKPVEDLENKNKYWYCPHCDEVVKSVFVDSPIANEYNHTYCGGCGQKIDWGEEDD